MSREARRMKKVELIYLPPEAAIALGLRKPGYYRRFYLAFPGEQMRPVTESELAIIGAQADGRGRAASGGRTEFLAAFDRLDGDLKAACLEAGLSRQTVYGLTRRHGPRYDADFARQFFDVKKLVRDRLTQRRVRRDRASEPLSCDCGLTIRRGARDKHRKSPSHRCAKVLRALVAVNLSLGTIGERFDLSAVSVGKIAKKLGVDTSRGQRRRGTSRAKGTAAKL